MGFIGRIINNFLNQRKKNFYLTTLSKVEHTKFVKELDENVDVVNFCHYGHMGDIFYSLPTIFALSKNKNIGVYINTKKKNTYHNSHKHHSSTNISEKGFEFIRTLLLAQKNVITCNIYNGELCDYYLNDYNDYPLNLKAGNICRWYFLSYGINYDTTKPWLQVPQNSLFNNSILIARSFRYRSPGINYRFLNNYNNLYFVGLDDEFMDMKNEILNLNHLKVDSALELAKAIAGCKLFIGNQSFPFALAESLKVKRVLEVDFLTPNVIVDGVNGFDFCFQPQFEKIIKNILE